MIDTYRMNGGETRKEVISDTIQDAYNISMGQAERVEDVEVDTYAAFLDSPMHQELMEEIEEAIRIELELQEGEEYFAMEEFDYDEILESQNSIICPICRNGNLAIESTSKIAFCICGANINMLDNQTGQSMGLKKLKEALASVIDRHYELCSTTQASVEFQMVGIPQELHAWCGRCGFYEKVV